MGFLNHQQFVSSEDKIYDQISKICDAQGVVGCRWGRDLGLIKGLLTLGFPYQGLLKPLFPGGGMWPGGGRLTSHDAIRLSWGLEFRNHIVEFRSGYL